jgi:hypothetical protein
VRARSVEHAGYRSLLGVVMTLDAPMTEAMVVTVVVLPLALVFCLAVVFWHVLPLAKRAEKER